MTLTVNIHIGLVAYATGTFATGDRRSSGGNAYQCIVGGSSTSAPTGTGAAINNGGVAYWKWLSAIDFSTLATLQASKPATFTQPIIWQFWNDGTISIPGATTPYLTLSGSTTSTTNTLTLTCAPGESFRDTLLAKSSTPLAFSAAAGVSFTMPSATPPSGFNFFLVNDANVIFDGLQFLDPNASSGCTVLLTGSGATGFVLRNCIFDATAQTGGALIIDIADTFAMNNCLFIDRQPVAGGKIPLRMSKAGNVVNCTAIAPNNPAATFFITSTATTASANTLRNIAAFGYAGVGTSSVAAANVVIDHCAASSATIGPAASITNGGSNLVSQTAVATFVSSTTDWRLLISATCIDAGATDTADIPSATDVAGTTRPQGSAWDIGAFEFQNLKLRGSTTARGQGSPSQTVPSKGASRAIGRGALAVGPTAASLRGTAQASGRNTATLSVAPIIDPWSAEYTVDYGPAGTFGGSGLTKSNGRSGILAAQPITARGSIGSSGRTQIGPVSALSSQGASRSTGSSTGTFIQAAVIPDPWTGDYSSDYGPISPTQFAGVSGQASGYGRATPSLTAAVSVNGTAAAKGRGNPNFALVASRGTAISRGRSSTPPSLAVMVGKGRSSAWARGLALYTAPPPLGPFGQIFGGEFGGSGIAWGTLRSTAQGNIVSPVALSALGTSNSSGSGSVSPPDTLVLFGRGYSQLTATTSTLVKTADLLTAGKASSRGAGRTGIAQPLTGTGVDQAKGFSTPAYNTVATIRGVSRSTGQLAVATLTSPLAAVGASQTKAKLQGALTTPLATRSKSSLSGAATITVNKLMTARGTIQISGQLGNAATTRLSAGSLSSSQGRSTISAVTALTASGLGDSFGQAVAPTIIQPISAYAAGTSFGSSQVAAEAMLSTGGGAISQGALSGRDGFTIAFAAAGVTQIDGKGTARQGALLSVTGSSSSSGSLAAFAGTVQLQASGRATASGGVGGVGFAPVALIGNGAARSASVARFSGNAALAGAGVGLSVGRCVTIATTLLQATGRSHGLGRLIATSSAAVGFSARGKAEVRGYLSSVLGLHASGLVASTGRSRSSGYYNITPDATGPRLSSLIQLPFFDSIDVGDVDFFSWDWSTRVSALGDPIISATVTSSPPGIPIVGTVVVGDIVQTRFGPSAEVETFSLRCTVTLRSGRVLHWSAALSVADF